MLPSFRPYEAFSQTFVEVYESAKGRPKIDNLHDILEPSQISKLGKIEIILTFLLVCLHMPVDFKISDDDYGKAEEYDDS